MINDHESVTGEFTRDREFQIPVDDQKRAIERFCGEGRAEFVEATQIAQRLTGNTIGANVMLLGFACQKGWLPVSMASLVKAIHDNGLAVEANLRVFHLGRALAHDPQAIVRAMTPDAAITFDRHEPESLDALIERRRRDLIEYQDSAYAERYARMVDKVRKAADSAGAAAAGVSEEFARNYYKLLAYKDEYEVARLYTDGQFRQALAKQFGGDYTVRFHMAPPLLAKIDPTSGRPKKRAFGPWLLPALGLLAKMKRLRGTAIDPFGRSAERRLERQLITEYEADAELVFEHLRDETGQASIQLLNWPDAVRGYGPVKELSIHAARAERGRRREALLQPDHDDHKTHERAAR